MRFEKFLDADLQALADLAGVLTADRQDAHDLLVHSLWDAKNEWTRAHLTGRPTRHVTRILAATYIFQRHAVLPEGSEPHRAANLSAADPVELDNDPVGLNLLIDQLPRTQRTVMVLRFFLGFNNREIAAAIGVPVRQTHSVLSRALSAVQLSPAESEQDAEDLRRVLAERGQYAPDPSQVRADLQFPPQELARRRRAAILMVAIAVIAVVATTLTIVFDVAHERPVTSTAPMSWSVTNDRSPIDGQPRIAEVQPR